MALNKEGFVGTPLSDSLSDSDNQIWYGETENGDMVVGIFNRDDRQVVKTLDLNCIGLSGDWNVRNIWTHEDEGSAAGNLVAELPAHGCKILKLSKNG